MPHRSLPVLLALGSLLPGAASAQGTPAVAGSRLFALDLSQTPVGEFPATLKLLGGSMEVALKDGLPMLKASAASEFLITLPQVLPEEFTLEFDLVPKACCNPEDLSFEGTPTQNRGAGSAHVVWDSDGQLMVVGGGEMYQAPMPEDFRTSLPGALTSVVAVIQGQTLRLYTNGRRNYTLADRRFARSRVLRVFLGGQDEGAHAVYLAGLRILAGAAPPVIAGATPTPPPGQPAVRPPPGQPVQPPPVSTQSGSTGTTTSAGSTIRPAGTGTIAAPAPAPAPTAVTAMTPQTGTITPATSQMTPVIRGIRLFQSNAAALIDVTALQESDSANTARILARFLGERHLTDDPDACPQDMRVKADPARCHRFQSVYVYGTSAMIEDWGLEAGASYTYRVGAHYDKPGLCVVDFCGVVYPSLPATIATPIQLIGKVEGRTGYAAVSVEPRNVQVTPAPSPAPDGWPQGDAWALISWTGMGYYMQNPAVPEERQWAWMVDQWVDGVPATCPDPSRGWMKVIDESNCTRESTQMHSHTWAQVGSGTGYQFQVTALFLNCAVTPCQPNKGYTSPPVKYQAPTYFTPERPARGSLTVIPPSLFLQARQGQPVPSGSYCSIAWEMLEKCLYRRVDFVWAPGAGATGYTLAVDEVQPDAWGGFNVGLGVRSVPASPAPGVGFELRAGSTVRACLTMAGDPRYPTDPRRGECIQIEVDPPPP